MARKDITDRQVCEAVRDYKAMVGLYYHKNGVAERPWAYDLLSERTGEPKKVCYRALERAHERDYIEYGVSLRTGWLTGKGRDLIK